jgi:hypothetical protein
MDQEVRNTKIAKMKAVGLSKRKISEELKRTGENLSVGGVAKVLAKTEVKAIIESEKGRLASQIPQCVTNYEHWIKNARVFHDKTDKDIAFRATTKVLESHGMISGATADQVKISITQNDVFLSPVVEKILEGFMGNILNAPNPKPALVEAIDAEIIDTQEDVREN